MILVTGGSGLVGKELITQLLAQGKAVRAIYNKTPLPSFNSEKLEQFQCNILDVTGLEEAMKGVEQLYHCAAIVTFNPKRRMEMFKVNVDGTTNVVNVAVDAGVKKMVHVSSVAALGRIKTDYNVDDKDLNKISALVQGIDENKDKVVEGITNNGVTTQTISDVINRREQLIYFFYDIEDDFDMGISTETLDDLVDELLKIN